MADGTGAISAAPDSTTYSTRCFAPSFTAASSPGSYVNYDIDQIGSSVAGSGLIVSLRFLEYARPLEEFLAYDDVK